RRYMPPWLPQAGYGDFADERRLTEAQIQTIADWVSDGAPEGVVPRRPVPAAVRSNWSLGPPDLVIQALQALTVPSEGRDLFWNSILTQKIPEARFVRAVEIRPGTARIVHHANLVIDRARSSRIRETAPGSGFPGMDLSFESDTFDPDSHFLFWKPGGTPRAD